MVVYYIFVKPFDGLALNRAEMMKETFLLSLAWFMPVFTEYVDYPQVRYEWGYTMTALFLIAVSVSVAVTLFYSLKQFYLLLKYFMWNKAGVKGKSLYIKYDIRIKKWKDRKVKNLDEDADEDESESSEKPNESSSIKQPSDTMEQTTVNQETEDGLILTKHDPGNRLIILNKNMLEESKQVIEQSDEGDLEQRPIGMFEQSEKPALQLVTASQGH